MTDAVVGFDIGNVILRDFTHLVPGALLGIAQIVETIGPQRVYLVSSCGAQREVQIRDRLAQLNLYPSTGLLPEHTRFCRSRAGKKLIAANLGLTHFTDDRLEVLGYLAEVVPQLFLFQPDEHEIAAHRHHLARVRVIPSWPELTAAILGQLG